MTTPSDSTQPTISMVITVYNTARFLRDALESIRRQTFTDWECIIVDDNSPDNSWEIYSDFVRKDARFKVICQKNGFSQNGLKVSRNRGHDAIQGKWLMFLDSDDYLHPRAMENLLRVAEQTNADMVDGSIERISEDWIPTEELLSIKTIDENAALQFESFSHEELLERVSNFSKCCYGTVWNSIFKVSTLGNYRHPEHHADPKKFIRAIDLVFRLLLIPRIKIAAALETPVIFYRTRLGSTTYSKKPAIYWIEIATTMANLYDAVLAENPFTPRQRKRFATWMASRTKLYFYGALRRSDNDPESLSAICEALRFLEKRNFPLYQRIPILRRFQFWLFIKTGKCWLIKRAHC
ncbi:MAG: glycosyltransferase family 2 protein [Kiritimatiellae bacterium]|nr:glycosyltransferase family 2 protein [Kiritimatiellia bacterium]